MPSPTVLIAAALLAAGNVTHVAPAAAAPQSNAMPGAQALRERALAAANEVFAAIESGDVLVFRATLDGKAVASLLLLDGVAQLIAAEKQIHYQLADTTAALGNDTAVVRTRWERRSISVGTQSARLRSGAVTLMFTMHKGSWKLSGFSGDNPFDRGTRR